MRPLVRDYLAYCIHTLLQYSPLPSSLPSHLVFPLSHPYSIRNDLVLVSMTSTNCACRLCAPVFTPSWPPRSAGVCSRPLASKKAETSTHQGILSPISPSPSLEFLYIHSYIHTSHTKRPGHLYSSPLCSIFPAAGVCTACPPLTAARTWVDRPVPFAFQVSTGKVAPGYGERLLFQHAAPFQRCSFPSSTGSRPAQALQTSKDGGGRVLPATERPGTRH